MFRVTPHLFMIALSAIALPLSATELTVAQYERDVVPVLVSINKDGKVSNMVVSQRLKPSMNRLLRETTDVVAAAAAEKGVSSQIVLRVRLENTKREDGQYDVRFVPLDFKAVPKGPWSWQIQGQRYALTDSPQARGSMPDPGSLLHFSPQQPSSPPPSTTPPVSKS